MYGVTVRSDLLHQMDSKHRQYEVDIREIGDLKASLEKMREDIYRFLNVPSERN